MIISSSEIYVFASLQSLNMYQTWADDSSDNHNLLLVVHSLEQDPTVHLKVPHWNISEAIIRCFIKSRFVSAYYGEMKCNFRNRSNKHQADISHHWISSAMVLHRLSYLGVYGKMLIRYVGRLSAWEWIKIIPINS